MCVQVNESAVGLKRSHYDSKQQDGGQQGVDSKFNNNISSNK